MKIILLISAFILSIVNTILAQEFNFDTNNTQNWYLAGPYDE